METQKIEEKKIIKNKEEVLITSPQDSECSTKHDVKAMEMKKKKDIAMQKYYMQRREGYKYLIQLYKEVLVESNVEVDKIPVRIILSKFIKGRFNHFFPKDSTSRHDIIKVN